jgi:structure-specific endonuclease subunit SLX1
MNSGPFGVKTIDDKDGHSELDAIFEIGYIDGADEGHSDETEEEEKENCGAEHPEVSGYEFGDHMESINYSALLITMQNQIEENSENMDSEEAAGESEIKTKQFFVYLLESSRGATYVGATMDVARRLRQHNKEITGGAVATGMRVQRGETWHLCCHVAHFPTWQAALQFEWRWKQLSRQELARPLARRAAALRKLLALEKPTTKSVPYSEWLNPPEIIFGENGENFRKVYVET